MQKLLLLLSFLWASSSVATAQQKAKKEQKLEAEFGKISAEERLMTTYPLDSSADCRCFGIKRRDVCRAAIWSIKIDLSLFRRIKLFKKSAFNRGNVEILYQTKDGYEAFRTIEAAVIQPDGTRQELTKKDFFQEKSTDDFTTKKIVFPNLAEGCIIEYEYTLESGSLTVLKPWFFQEDIPVRHSELWLSIPEYYDYVYLFRGRHPLKKEKVRNAQEGGTFNLSTLKLSADSVPALKTEAYITTMTDYLSQVSFQISRIRYSSERVKDYLTNWKDVAEVATNSDYLGDQYLKKSNYGDVWEAVKPLLLSVESEEGKIKIVYDYIANNIRWSQQFAIRAYVSLNDAFKKKQANSGELNMMLIACLLEAGVKAAPMLVSTRGNGKSFTDYPMVEQFNHLVCYIERGEKSLIIDAGNRYRPIENAASTDFEWTRLGFGQKNPRWVPIVAPLSNKVFSANFKLDEKGTLIGSISNNYRGYAAVNEREDEADTEKNHEKARQALAKDFPDIKIDSITIANLDNVEESFKRIVFCTIPNAATTTDDLIYIKPTLKTDFDENPFKQSKRDYPVDFSYPFKDQFILNLTIPEGYVVEELPKSIRINLPESGGVFQYVSTANGNLIQLVIKIQLDQLHFEPENYAILKQFFQTNCHEVSRANCFEKERKLIDIFLNL